MWFLKIRYCKGVLNNVCQRVSRQQIQVSSKSNHIIETVVIYHYKAESSPGELLSS